MMDEDKAERIRATRGNFEVEISSTGESGLHETLMYCKKNPNHENFIPLKDFNIDSFPSRYRDNLLVDYVQATSDLTCRVSVSHISEDRPKTWPNTSNSDQVFPSSGDTGENFMMTGTGLVNYVYKYTQMNTDCECDDCTAPGTRTPKKARGIVYMITANHVVCNSEEVRHTKCKFFYDSPETDDKVFTLTGGKVVLSDVKGDKCLVTYFIHDVELLDKFEELYKRWWGLRNEVFLKYHKSPGLGVPGVGCDTNVDHDLCFIVSHPHGCRKVVTIGTWTQRQVVNKYSTSEDITYKYNTPTCPGSSGAAAISLCKENMTYWFHNLPPHSEGPPGNDNNSGVAREEIAYVYK